MSKKRRRALATWKVILITIASIIGLLGVSIFVMYLLGYFEEERVAPISIEFVLDEEEYNVTTGMFEVSEDFYLTITSTTENVNVRDVKLSLGSTVAENGYIDNGIIKVPQTVKLDVPFKVELSREFNKEVADEFDYINGGITTLRADSVDNLPDPIEVRIAVDVPVHEISGYLYDAGDTNKTPLSNNEVIYGSHFKVGLNFAPSDSEYMFSGSEKKKIFYRATNNSIDFDYTTQTFSTRDISAEGTTDTIDVYVFTSADEQRKFWNEHGSGTAYEINQAALNYFDNINKDNASQEVYKHCQIKLTVKNVEIDSFEITNTSFGGYVDEYLTISQNNRLGFDNTLGISILDEEGSSMNSIYAQYVGLAVMNVEQNANINIYGGRIMEVKKILDTSTNETTFKAVLKEKTFLPENFYPTTVVEENLTTTTYYFTLPDITNLEMTSYKYRFSSSSDTTLNFKVALFIEKENGEYDIFFNEGQNFDTLSSFEIRFTSHQEEQISWKNDGQFVIDYDSDKESSNPIDLSKEVVVPSENVYQTVRYFVYTSQGGENDEILTSLSTKSAVLYTREDISIPGFRQDNVYLYEIVDPTVLFASGPLKEEVNVIFVTVRSNADNTILNSEGGIFQAGDKYSIVQVSNRAKSLIVETTMKFQDLVGTGEFSSNIDGKFILNEDNGEKHLYVPSVFYKPEDANKDSFTLTLTLSNAEQNGVTATDLQTLYNTGLSQTDQSSPYLRIEFRDQNGNLGTFVDDGGNTKDIFSLGNFNFTGTETITGTVEVTISEDFNDTVGTYFVPYLVYYNGVNPIPQEKEISLSYGVEEFDGFTVYSQLATEESQYRFVYDQTLLSSEGPVYVNINANGERSIEWTNSQGGSTAITEEGSLSDVEKLSQYFEVVIFDQYGKEIQTNVASFVIKEDQNSAGRYINIVNGSEITGFNSTNGEQVSTNLYAEISSKFKTETISLNFVSFKIESVGVSKVEYNNSTVIGDEENYEEGSFAQVDVKKYALSSQFIELNKLIKVWIGNDSLDDPNGNYKDIKFRLNEDYLSGLGNNVNTIFSTATNNSGFLTLRAGNNVGSDVLSPSAENIVAIEIRYLFAVDCELVFDVYDDNNLVNIRLNLTILGNIKYTDNFNSYKTKYEDYLTRGNLGNERSKLVFGGDSLSINEYLALSYKSNENESVLNWTSANSLLYINNQQVTEGSNSLVHLEERENVTYLHFSDVKRLTSVDITLYFSSSNDYALRVDIGFVINPNYLIVQKETFINLKDITSTDTSVSQDSKKLNHYYEIYEAKEYIDKIIFNNNPNGDEVEPLSFKNTGINFGTSNSIIEISTETEEALLSKKGNFVGTLGQVLDTNIGLYDSENVSANFEFILLSSEKDIEEIGCSNLYFSIGYAENAEAVMVEIIGSDALNKYEVLENNGEYVVTLLELGRYNLRSDVGHWAIDTDSEFIKVQNTTEGNYFDIVQLPSFNVQESVTFVYNNEDRISVDLRLSKVGLIYVAYEENYDNDDVYFAFEDIVSDNTSDESALQLFLQNLEDENIFNEYVAGKTYNIVTAFDPTTSESDTVTENGPFGFHYQTSTSSYVKAELSLKKVTRGYEDIVKIDGYNIILNSLVTTSEDVYAIFELTLTQNRSGNSVTYKMYYRIKILPNWNLDEVNYPYNNDAEYFIKPNFDINFEEDFTSLNASSSQVGKNRFSDLTEINGYTLSENEKVTHKYSVYDIIINGREYEDPTLFFTYTLDEDSGEFSIEVKDTSVEIVIRIVKTYYIETTSGDSATLGEVLRSQKLYKIVYKQGVPDYEYAVTGGKVEESAVKVTIKEDGDDFADVVTVNGKYQYTINVYEKNEDVQNPCLDVFAHVTDAEEIETGIEPLISQYLYEILRIDDGDKLYQVVNAGGNYELGAEKTFSAEDKEYFGEYVFVKSGETPDKDRYITIIEETSFVINEISTLGYIVKIGSGTETTSEYFFVPLSDIDYFDFRMTDVNGIYELTFLTKDRIMEDGAFSIGIYTSYLNIFEITFEMDGGFEITYNDISSSRESGKNYNVSEFITSISQNGEDVLGEFRFTEIKDDNRFEIADSDFKVAYTNETFSTNILAEHVLVKNSISLAEGLEIFSINKNEETAEDEVLSLGTLNKLTELGEFSFSEVTVGDVLYTKITFANETPILVNVLIDDTTEETTLNLRELYFDKDKNENTVQTEESVDYRFYFTLTFSPASKMIQTNETVTFIEDSEEEGVRYSQNTISLDLTKTSSNLYTALKNRFFEDFGRDGYDSFTFENGTPYETITVETVGEKVEEFEENFVVQYRYNNNVIYTFNLKYVFGIEPNVKISANYPTPSYDGGNLEESRLESEYIDNNTTIEDFFNTKAQFTLSDAKARFYVERTDSNLDNHYAYNYTLDIKEISNTNLTIGGVTYTTAQESFREGTLIESEGQISGLDKLNLTFKLQNTGISGKVVFTLTVNNLPKDYIVVVSNNRTVTLETNIISSVQNYEEVYAEDMSTYADNNLFKYERLLKYNFLNSAHGTYYLRFDSPDAQKDPLIYEVNVLNHGVDNIVDLKKDYQNFVFNGVYTNRAHAEVGSGGEDWSVYFRYEPKLTNRVVLLYANNEISRDIIEIKLSKASQSEITYTLKENVEILNSYYLRFENGDKVMIVEHSFEGINGVETTDNLNVTVGEGYTYAGTYISQANAENKEQNVSKDIFAKDIKFTASKNGDFTNIDDVEFEKGQVDSITEYRVGFSMKNATESVDTNYTYRIRLSVRFRVTSSATDHEEIIYAGAGAQSILSFPGLGIIDAKTGKNLTTQDVGENRRLDLKMYGFGDLKITESADNELGREAWRIHNDLIKNSYNTGIIPRYNASLLGGTISGNATQDSNYASLNAGDVYGSDWSITPRGASTNGNYVLLKITYTTYLDIDQHNPVSVSANLKFKIMPSYDISYKTSSTSELYRNEIFIEEMNIDGTNTHVATNGPDNAYIVSKDSSLVSSSQTHYLYINTNSETEITPIWKADLNGTNSGYMFNYTIENNGAQAEYNSYLSNIGTDSTWSDSNGDKTHSAVAQNGTISFTTSKVNIGDKNYYFDAVDNFGYRVRIYFQIQADLTPIVANINSRTVSEGANAEIGATSNTVEITGGYDYGGGGQYSYVYTLAATKNDLTNKQVYIDYMIDGGERTSVKLEENKLTDFTIEYKYGYAYTEQDSSSGSSSTLYASVDNFSEIQDNATEIKLFLNVSQTQSNITLNKTKNLVFGISLGENSSGLIISPDGYIRDSLSQTPTYGSDTALQLSISGISANLYNSKIIPARSSASFDTNASDVEAESDIQSVNIASVWFEDTNGNILAYADMGGSNHGTETDGTGTMLYNEKAKFVVGGEEDAYIYKDGVVHEAPKPGESTFTIPHFSGKLYGDSNTIEVVMVVAFTTSTDDKISINGTESQDFALIREPLTIQRGEYGALQTTNFVDASKVTIDNFNTTLSEGGVSGITIYNDTLEIELSKGASLKYAITTGSEPSDNEYKSLENKYQFDVRNHIRISTKDNYVKASEEEADALQETYTLYVKDVKGDYKVKYSDETLTLADGKYSITLKSFGSASSTTGEAQVEGGDAKITLNIADVDELTSSNYVSREIFSIAKVTYSEGGEEGEQKPQETEFYQQTGSVRIYPHFSSISANMTSAVDYVVDDYYRVSTATSSGYYVISPTDWAGKNGTVGDAGQKNDSINYSTYFEINSATESTLLEFNNAHKIASMPYIYSYEVVGGATVDSMGTVTTNEDFKIESDNIQVSVRMRVSGLDGLYNDEDGILLNSKPLTFILRYYDSGNNVDASVSGLYSLKNDNIDSLIVLNSEDTITAYGGASTVATPISTSDDAVQNDGTYLVPTNSPFMFNRLPKTEKDGNSDTSNNEFKIVKANSDDYLVQNNTDSYTYTSQGTYQSMFVEMYRSAGDEVPTPSGSVNTIRESEIKFKVHTAEVVVYNSQTPEVHTAEYSLSGNADASTFTSLENGKHQLSLRYPGGNKGEENDTVTIEGDRFFDVASGKQIVTGTAGGGQTTFSDLIGSESGMFTKEIVVINNGQISFHRITFFAYEGSVSETEISWTTNISYNLSNIFGKGVAYQISSKDSSVVTVENYQNSPDTFYKEVYYVLDAGKMTKHVVTFNIYTTGTTSLTTWVQEDATSPMTATINVASVDGTEQESLFDIFGIDGVTFSDNIFKNGDITYEIYEISSTNILTKIENNNFVVEEKNIQSESIDWTETTRSFFVKIKGEKETYRRFSLTFYKFEKEITVSAITQYNQNFLLRNLDYIVKEELSTSADVSWKLYNENNLTLNDITNIRIDNDTVDENSKYIVSGQFFVLISDTYYKVNLDITCAQGGGNLTAYTKNENLQEETNLTNLQVYTFDEDGNLVEGENGYETLSLEEFLQGEIGLSSLGNLVVENSAFFKYETTGSVAKFDESVEISSIDLRDTAPFVKNLQFVYKIVYTYGQNNERAVNYTIFNVNFVVLNNPLPIRHFYMAQTSATTYNLNELTPQIRVNFPEITSASIIYYEDEGTTTVQNNLITLSEVEQTKTYILREFYVKVGENFEKIVLILHNLNVKEATV